MAGEDARTSRDAANYGCFYKLGFLLLGVLARSAPLLSVYSRTPDCWKLPGDIEKEGHPRSRHKETMGRLASNLLKAACFLTPTQLY